MYESFTECQICKKPVNGKADGCLCFKSEEQIKEVREAECLEK